MSLPLHLAIGLLAMSSTQYASAQTMYKCGTTYSQTPCGAGQKAIEIKTDDPCDNNANRYSSACIMRPYKPSKLSAEEERRQALNKKTKEETDERNKKEIASLNLVTPPDALVEENKKVCLANITAALKDPESAKFGKVIRMGAELDTRYETLTPSIMYTVMVNAKNGYGGYTGSKPYLCVFSTDEKRFVRVWSPS